MGKYVFLSGNRTFILFFLNFLSAEPAIRRGDTALRGSRGPDATRTNTGQSRRKLSPLLARLRPPYSRRRIRDGTERRRGQTGNRTFKMTEVDLFPFKSLINEFVLISTCGKEIYLKERRVSY